MDIWIGTSGYSYADWVGGFYPSGTQSRAMLDYYCGVFPIVELNFTFYRMPAPGSLDKLAERSPAGFQFCVKLSRTLSHEFSEPDIAPFAEAVRGLQHRGQLLSLLCQFPQSVHRTRPHMDWIERLRGAYEGLPLAVEFRHRSWRSPEIDHWLRERRLDLVAVDAPPLSNLYPSGWVQSSRTAYVRFHSRNAANWYQSDKERYDYDYDDPALVEWIGALQAHKAETDRVLLLFNNCHRSQAAANAQRMRELLRQMMPGVNIIEPFATPRFKQLSLFE